MRFFTAVTTLGLVALVSAQTSASANITQSSTTHHPSSSVTLSPAVTCLQKCGSADVCCQAACVNVPCPSQSQANATTECATQCPQGNGTKDETQQYAACQSSCISSLFLSTATGAAATGGSNGASATGSGSGSEASATGIDTNSASGSGSGSSSATGSASSSSSTGNSANDVRVGFAGAGLLGLIVAGLAL